MNTFSDWRSAICYIFCLSALLQTPVDLTAQTTKDRRGPFVHPSRSVRDVPYDVKHIRLELVFDMEAQQFKGKAIHRLAPFAPTRQIALDAADMTIKNVSVSAAASKREWKNTKFKNSKNRLTISLDSQLDAGEELMVSIEYVVTKPRNGAHFVVPDEREPDQPKMVWTQSEPEFARYWFPCFDSPTDRCTSEIIATVPGDYFVLSNGVLQDKQKNENGTATWHWFQAKTHVTYLMSVVAGRFTAYEQSWDGIPIISYVPPHLAEQSARSFEKTPAMMEFFSKKIGVRYPWPKYTQICVDEYGWGGMEHTSATTLNMNTLHDEKSHLDVSSDGLVAHELAHQWFGDLLTCKDWGELWLNESFATYFATLWKEHDLGADEALWGRYLEAESYFGEDAKRYRRPIVSYRYPSPGAMFDRHSYPKGARVLHMLRYVLGDDLFWKAIHEYTSKNQFAVVETADLRTAIERATGRGMNWFFDQWVYHGGHPEYEVSTRWDDAEKLFRLTVKQTQKADDLTMLFRMPIEIELVDADNQSTTRRVTVAKREETFSFHLDAEPRRVCFDPQDWVLKKLSFDKTKQEWIDQLAYSENIICRVRAADALADFKTDADVRAALIRSATGDKFWAVRQRATKALGKFTGKDTRGTLLHIADTDSKSKTRIEAIKALADFPDPATGAQLRKTIASDRSYYAVAEALRILAKVDKKKVHEDLLAAMGRTSRRDVILRAAADGLADLDHQPARKKLLQILDQPSAPSRRTAVLGALAKFGGSDADMTEAIAAQLDDQRSSVRSAAIRALVETDDPAVIEILLRQRGRSVGGRRELSRLDEAITKLRDKSGLKKLQRQVEGLRKDNRSLQRRLDKLEESKGP